MLDHVPVRFDHTMHSIDIFLGHSGERVTLTKFFTEIDTTALEFYKSVIVKINLKNAKKRYKHLRGTISLQSNANNSSSTAVPFAPTEVIREQLGAARAVREPPTPRSLQEKYLRHVKCRHKSPEFRGDCRPPSPPLAGRAPGNSGTPGPTLCSKLKLPRKFG
ncbi:hypothetical protein EVAR_16331_1 [Eumeta japonica]|uniref:Uncharacterized protein n=1 Tax=Eumeta variegata TaxID=151549 RepID=A0A4C1VF14_EUMVA|nr:hypothetical protein EVAR_16331_1 [Eumeta japonica]